MRSRLVGVLLVVVTLAVSACAPSTQTTAPPPAGQPGAAAQPPAAPKRINAAIRGDPKTLSESVNIAAGGSSSAGVRELELMVNAGLLVLDTNGELRPELAEAVPTLENGLWKLLPDGRMETTWKLKPNLRWHDGTPLTADDFLFTTTLAQDRALTWTQDQAFGFVDTVEAPDAQTVRATWKSTYVDADKLFTPINNNRKVVLPKHLLESAYQEDKANFTTSPYLSSQYVGAGPYRLKEWVLGSHMTLEAFDGYVLGRPKIDQIQVRFILDTNTMVANLLAGEVQVTIGRGLTPEQAITVKEQWREGVVDAGLQNTTSLFPQFVNSEPAMLTDVRFRRALLHALDRQQMVDTFLAGLVPVANSIITPDEPEFKDVDPVVAKYPFDPRRSMELLNGMGLTRGADGFYIDPNTGGRVTIEVRSRSHVLREKVQQVIADEWGRVGLVGQPLVIAEQSVNDRVYQSTFPGFYFRFGGPDQIVSWVSAQSPLPENNFVGQNTMRYRNPEYDALVQRYVTTIPKAERTQALAAMAQHTTEQLVPIPLYHEPEPVLISNRLVNAGGSRGRNLQTWNAHEWELKA
jgi:peptide/nickel transport system substrate-binding protein